MSDVLKSLKKEAKRVNINSKDKEFNIGEHLETTWFLKRNLSLPEFDGFILETSERIRSVNSETVVEDHDMYYSVTAITPRELTYTEKCNALRRALHQNSKK